MSYVAPPAKYDPYASATAPPRALPSAQLPAAVQRAKPSRSESYAPATGAEEEDKPVAGVTEYVNGFLKEIKRFRTGSTTPAWNECDTWAYVRAIQNLTEAQATECLFVLREREEFRPSVKKVKAVADELLGNTNRLPDPDMEGKQTDAYKPLPIPERKAIAGRTSEDARAAARARLENLPGWGIARAENKPAKTTRPSNPLHAERVKRQLEQAYRECQAEGTL